MSYFYDPCQRLVHNSSCVANKEERQAEAVQRIHPDVERVTSSRMNDSTYWLGEYDCVCGGWLVGFPLMLFGVFINNPIINIITIIMLYFYCAPNPTHTGPWNHSVNNQPPTIPTRKACKSLLLLFDIFMGMAGGWIKYIIVSLLWIDIRIMVNRCTATTYSRPSRIETVIMIFYDPDKWAVSLDARDMCPPSVVNQRSLWLIVVDWFDNITHSE